MPDYSRNKQPTIDAELLFIATRLSKEAPADSEMRIRAVTELRAYSKEHECVRERLRDLLKDDDIFTRILAAEALSVAGAYSEEAVPVLKSFIDYVRKKGLIDQYQTWLAICFLALEHYSVKAIHALDSVLFYLFRQDNVRLKIAATRVIARFAKVSEASRIVLLGLYKSTVPDEVKRLAQGIIEGKEFKSYMMGKEK